MRTFQFDPQGLRLTFSDTKRGHDTVADLHEYVSTFMGEADVELWGLIRTPSSLHEEKLFAEITVRDAITSEVFNWLAERLTGDTFKLEERVNTICALYRSELKNLKIRFVNEYLSTINTMWNKEAVCHQIHSATDADGSSQAPKASSGDTVDSAGT